MLEPARAAAAAARAARGRGRPRGRRADLVLDAQRALGDAAALLAARDTDGSADHAELEAAVDELLRHCVRARASADVVRQLAALGPQKPPPTPSVATRFFAKEVPLAVDADPPPPRPRGRRSVSFSRDLEIAPTPDLELAT